MSAAYEKKEEEAITVSSVLLTFPLVVNEATTITLSVFAHNPQNSAAAAAS